MIWYLLSTSLRMLVVLVVIAYADFGLLDFYIRFCFYRLCICPSFSGKEK